MDFTSSFLLSGAKVSPSAASTSAAAEPTFSPGSTFLAYVAGSPPTSLLVRTASTLQLIRSWRLPESCPISSPPRWSSDGAFLLVASTASRSAFVFSLDPAREGPNQGLGQDEWVARVGVGEEGLASAHWAPTFTSAEGASAGRNATAVSHAVVCFAQDELRATIYDLSTGCATVVEDPKGCRLYRHPKLGGTFALLRRHRGKDGISILAKGLRSAHPSSHRRRDTRFSDAAWDVCENFAVATCDAAGMAWSPDGLYLAVWDSPLEYKLHVYSALGAHRSTLQPFSEALARGTSSGQLLQPSLVKSNTGSTNDAPPAKARKAKTAPPRRAAAESLRSEEDRSAAGSPSHLDVSGGGLGIRCVEWRPTGGLLAVGGYDEKIRLLEDSEWHEVAVLQLSQTVLHRPVVPSADGGGGTSDARAWREPMGWIEESGGRDIISYEEASFPVCPPAVRVDYAKPFPRTGVSAMAWSSDGRFLAARNDKMPSTVLIWRVGAGLGLGAASARLVAVLLHASAVETFRWQPAGKAADGGCARLAISCEGSAALYFWEGRWTTAGGASGADRGRAGGETMEMQRAEAIPIPHASGASEMGTISTLTWSADGRKLVVSDSRRFCCALMVDE